MPRDSLPIVDAHAHFWDLDARYYPWLRDPDPIPFRYGDYGPLRRNYLPEDYRRDSRARHRRNRAAAGRHHLRPRPA